MPSKKSRGERLTLAKLRLTNILSKHGIATARTLEQKISDAGPFDQRIDPHVLTTARKELIEEKIIYAHSTTPTPWYTLTKTPQPFIQERLSIQLPLYTQLSAGTLPHRLGQSLEIAIYKSLLQQHTLKFLGNFTDLDAHDDSTLYVKEDPPTSLSGNSSPRPLRLDFWVIDTKGTIGGIEAKNVREWMYPDRVEIKSLIAKSLNLNCVPILIARRIHFVTFKLLSACGVLFHQTYNQLFPTSDITLANEVKKKDTLGYHDIRVGNTPDARLNTFLSINLPNLLPTAAIKFDEYKDLLSSFVEDMEYKEFAARVLRRQKGINEDFGFDPNEIDF